MRRPSSRVVPVLSLLAALVVASADATTILDRLPFERVATEAARIVHATVTATAAGRDESGAPATWITLAITRTVKGDVGDTLTIKQFGTVEPLPDGAVTRFPGMPRYTVGEEVLLFLRADSRRGFTSPVGFEQGVYRVQGGQARSAFGKAAEPLDAVIAEAARLNGWKTR